MNIVKSRRLMMLAGVVGLLSVAAGAWSWNASSHRAAFGTWGPSLGNVTAIRQLPPVAAPNAAVAQVVRATANATGGQPDEAVRTLHLLRQGLGKSHASAFAYAPTGDALCLVLWRRQGVCPQASQTAIPGVLTVLSPGGPGYVGQPDTAGPAVAGLVSDDVVGVDLVLADGTSSSLRPVNGVFFSDLPYNPDASFTVTLRFTYSDGKTRSDVLTAIPGSMVPKVTQ